MKSRGLIAIQPPARSWSYSVIGSRQTGTGAYLPPYFMRASAVRLRMKSVFFLGHSDKAILLEKVSDSFHQIADPGDQVQKGKTRDRTAEPCCRPCGYR